jgi:hypothetical protein
MWFDWTNYLVKMVLTLAIFPQLIALKGLWKVFENRQKKSLKVFQFFWSWRLRTLIRYHVLNGSTHVKMHKLYQTCSRLVAMLFQQLVNRMCSHCLFPACWQVINGLLAICYKVVELNRLITSYSNNLLSSCNSTICQQVVSDNLVATW